MSQDVGNGQDQDEADEEERRHPMVAHLVRRGIPLLVLMVVVAGAFMFWM